MAKDYKNIYRKVQNELRNSEEMVSKIMFQGNRNKKQNVVFFGADGILLFSRCSWEIQNSSTSFFLSSIFSTEDTIFQLK